MNGICESSGIVMEGSSAPLPALASPSPRTSATPVPRNVSARPDTIWSAWKWMDTMAWSARQHGARRPCASDDPDPGVAGLEADPEAGEGAHEHHALRRPG